MPMWQQEEIEEHLRTLLQRPEEQINLAEAALCVARFEYPDLDHVRYLRRLDDMANAVALRLAGQPKPDEPLRVVSEMNRYLFEEEGFCGDAEDYYDPRNSFLNDVLDRKTGIPITLSTVYTEIADRLCFPLVGVGMPGHFLVRHRYLELLIDPFSQGRVLSVSECEQRINQVLGNSVPFHESYLTGVTKQHTVTRMLNNLRNVYANLRQFPKALQITSLVLALHPDSAADWHHKAAFLIELKRYAEARLALERYLELAPDAEDADELRQTALNLRKTLAQLN